MRIICVIPAFNEAETIAKVVNSVKPYAEKIVVIDDCSNDKTGLLAENEGAFVLRHIINRGQGAALQTGDEYALLEGAEIIVHFDADGQFIAEEIKNIAKPIIQGEADAVFGSRFLSKKSDIPFLKKNIIIPLARLINKIFLDINLTDPQSGFRALSAEVAKNMKIEHAGMAHCSEILNKVIKAKYRIKEVPITVIYNNFGQRFSGGIKILKELFIGALIK